MKNNMGMVIVVGVAALAVGFGGGMMYEKNSSEKQPVGVPGARGNFAPIGGQGRGAGAIGFTVGFPVGNFTTSTTATGAALTPGAWAIVDGVNLLEKL